MNTNATSGQEASESVDEQRARWEGANFGMTVCANGVVNVENRNYGDDSGAHIYSVRVENGEATGCSCPHATHRGAHCKHQQAVENRPLVVSSASAAGATYAPVATDGGHVEGEREVEKPTGGDETPENGRESGPGGKIGGDTDGDGERGAVDVHGCAACGGFAYGDDEFCSDECRRQGHVDETPL